MNTKDPIFSAVNHHTADCGEPPAWLREAPTGSRSYFENMYGEQWVAEASEDHLRLTGGDVGWETYHIDRPDYAALIDQLAKGGSFVWSGGKTLVLGREETVWLLAVCLGRASS